MTRRRELSGWVSVDGIHDHLSPGSGVYISSRNLRLLHFATLSKATAAFSVSYRALLIEACISIHCRFEHSDGAGGNVVQRREAMEVTRPTFTFHE